MAGSLNRKPLSFASRFKSNGAVRFHGFPASDSKDNEMTSVLTSAMIPWAKIKIQIDKFEKSPDSLSREQLLALSYLAPFMEEPELADSDYVSELMRMIIH